ncbi:SHUGOSHIN 2 isoform X1 [Raphanus sativus]|uniref:SHUGOSHIN 2 isoform X1 n=1 Tax=Raphanus sativus TaxID=3726 RepID=A0A9W3C6Q2_RAPSA|nr:SHUGOSHIN 2 isoform X1 [Raphanus sativus]
MSSATVLDEDNPAAKEVRIHKDPLMSSAQRRKLSDISNLEQMKTQKQQQQQAMLFSSKEYAEKLEKENMTLMKALAHRNKIIELSGVEIQKLRINLRNVQEKNLQLAQANSHMLAELNANRDSLKLLQHELCCKNVLLEARKRKTEEQGLPSTDNDSKDKAHDVNHKDTKRKRTSMIKRKLFIISSLLILEVYFFAYLPYVVSFSASESSVVKPIQGKENVNSKRRVSGVIDTTVIPEVTCQTEEDAEKGFVSQGTNQIADNIVSNKFVLDAANPVKDGVNSKRQCVRRKSTRFDVQATEQTETVLEMDVAKDTKETARISLKRRSARLRPEEAEPCKSFHERDELKETVKGRRVSSRKQSARFDLQETEVTGTLNADDAGKASGVIDTTVIPEITCQAEYDAEKGFDSQGTNQIVDNIDNIVNEKFVLDPANPIKGSVHSNRPCVRKKSTRVNVQVAEQTETVLKMDDAKETKETARLSLRRVSARLRPKEAEPCKSFHEIDEVEETIKTRRVSSKQQSARFDLQEPEVTGTLNAADAGSLVSDGSEAVEPSESRQDTKDTNGKCRVTTRRQSAKCISQTATETGGAIKDVVTDPSISINTVQESDVLPSTVSPEDLEKESKNKPEAEETGGMMRRASMRRASRHAAEKVQSYREVSLKVKLRREC